MLALYQSDSWEPEIDESANCGGRYRFPSWPYYQYYNHECPDHPFVLADDPTKPEPVTFMIHFKATGIQATGFADYKEAFAALNGN